MAVIELDAWWVAASGMEFGLFESKATADAVAANNSYPSIPVMVVPCKIFKEVED